jgi:cathepsin L
VWWRLFQWIMDNKGMALKTTYRYLGQGGWCNQHIRDSSVRVQSYVNVTASNELDLQDAVVDGSVSIATDASHNDFGSTSLECTRTDHCFRLPELLDHAVLAVDYGSDPDFADYWIVKNS